MHSYNTAKERIGALNIAQLCTQNRSCSNTRKTRLGKSMIYALNYFRALLAKNDNVVGVVSGLVGMSVENDQCLA